MALCALLLLNGIRTAGNNFGWDCHAAIQQPPCDAALM